MKVDSLQSWLDTATRGLCEDAKARVRVDVEAHFAAANDGHIAAGHTATSAQRLALESLGSAKKARRRYARTYLTCSDNKLLKGLGDRSNTFSSLVSYVPLAGVLLLQVLMSGSVRTVLAAVVISACYGATLGYVAAVRFRFGEDVKRSLGKLVAGVALLMAQLPALGFVFGYATLYAHLDRFSHLGPAFYVPAGALLFALYMLMFFRGARLLRIRRKLN